MAPEVGVDAIVGGLFVAATMVVGYLYWQLLVRPDVLLSFWHDGSATHDGFFEEHPAGLRALKWVTGGVLLLLAFLTGLVWSFLIGTTR